MKIRRMMKPPRASTITTSASQGGNPFFSSHHNAGVKRIARVAARKIGASTSLEYFRPNTTITMAAAASNGRMTGEPRVIMVFIVNASLCGILCKIANKRISDNHTRFLPSAVELKCSIRALFKNVLSHLKHSPQAGKARVNKVPGSDHAYTLFRCDFGPMPFEMFLERQPRPRLQPAHHAG